jgi:hypothetical protein
MLRRVLSLEKKEEKDASQALVALLLAREWDNETATRPVAKKVLRHDLEET